MKVTKTPKCFVGGAFIRSESGRVVAIHDRSGAFFANIPLCSKKDLRNAVEAAAKGGTTWSKRSPYNRAQILYRLAEMLEARSAEMIEAITLTDAKSAAREVRATVDRIVHFAGWADKYEQVFGTVNPVASSHFNFTITEPVGIVGIIAPGMVETDLLRASGFQGRGITPTESVNGMIKVIDGMTLENNSAAINYDGKVIPW